MWSAFGAIGIVLIQAKGVTFTDASSVSSGSSLAICSSDVPANASTAGNGRALDHPGGRENDTRPAQRRDDTFHDRPALIRAPGRLGRRLDHQRQVGSGRRAQAESCSKPARVVGHGLRATGVVGEGLHWALELPGHPGHEQPGRLLDMREAHSRMAEQRKLDGEAEAADVAAAQGDQVSVGPRQCEASRQPVRIGRNAEQRQALFIGQQSSTYQGFSSVPQRPL